VAGRRRKQGTISDPTPRPRHLTLQHLELVAQNQQLKVLDVQATTTPNERSQNRPEPEVEEREGHYRRSSQPAAKGRDTTIGALHPFRSPEEGLARAIATLRAALGRQV
jgi:hypothetical protein